MDVTKLSRDPIDIYLASGNHDSVGSLKTYLEKIKINLLFEKFEQGKTSQFIKVCIMHIKKKFHHRRDIVFAVMDIIETLITDSLDKFKLYKLMYTLSFGIYDMGFMFSLCDTAAEIGLSVFTILKNHSKVLSNEKFKNFMMIQFINDLNRFYTYGELNKKYISQLRLPNRVSKALTKLTSAGVKRSRQFYENSSSDANEYEDDEYVSLPALIYKKKNLVYNMSTMRAEIGPKLVQNNTIKEIHKPDMFNSSSDNCSEYEIICYDETDNLSDVELTEDIFVKMDDDSIETTKYSNSAEVPSNRNSKEQKPASTSKLTIKGDGMYKIDDKSLEHLDSMPKFSEFYDREKNKQLLLDSKRKDSQAAKEINKAFADGYVLQEKDHKLFTTLNRLLKMKKSSSKKKNFTAMDVMLDNRKYTIFERLGAGGFGVVYLAADFKKSTNIKSYKAIKIQENNSDWEFYINKVISYRLDKLIDSEPISQKTKCIYYQCAKSLVKLEKNISFGDHSIIIMDFVSSGTLLELSNFVKKDKNGLFNEQSRDIIATFFTLELMKIINCLHKVGIIHGDLKADNCMITNYSKDSIYQIDFDNDITSLRLIDFGKSADMQLFDDKNKKFIHNLRKTDFQDCPEVREKRPFNYEIDYYGIAAIAHTLLFNEFIENRMDVVNGERWYSIKRNIPRANRDLWDGFFKTFLNSTLMNEGAELPFFNKMNFYMDKFKEKLLNNPKTNDVLEQVRLTLTKEKQYNSI
ncbi:uncharacterized protein HGUI_03161 [Hanseniaspora guilliermondii]|uniref:Protein kinase domain-containing protein n=1 Tax=Hanseniaspora guilliermondii TaxID=56406 RepID=A0A1L0CR06_9ASCO|nr:uncharacterized protein HGUI_03161 [Hanseniaspora guilliermondii]